MIPAVIVSHGSLGEAYLQALAAIYGECSGLTALSNAGLSAEALAAALDEKVAGFDQGLLFTDYFGGSCATACLAELSRRPGLRLISGLNLPVLLYYLAHRHELEMEALIQGILQRGRDAVRELVSPCL